VTERIKEKVGQWVEAGDLIVEVYDTTTVNAEIMIAEKHVGAVMVGQSVKLKARAYPWQSFYVQVVAVAPRAIVDESGLNQRLIRVTTEIENIDLLLKPDMTGNAKIEGPARPLYALISRRFVNFLRVEFWSWW
jgi:Cu(I)/Ag(I) efflux system membrane fusion protein